MAQHPHGAAQHRQLDTIVSASSGLCLVTSSWPTLPLSGRAGAPPAAAILAVHGWNHYISPSFDWLAARLAPHGVALFGLDQEAHGRSVDDAAAASATGGAAARARAPAPGCCSRRAAAAACGRGRLRGYLPGGPDGLAADVVQFALDVKRRLAPGTPLFLHGESLGGAVAVLAAVAAPPGVFAGLIVLAPMTRIGAAHHPHPAVVALGALVAAVAPWAPLAPVRDIAPVTHKDVHKVREAAAALDPLRYAGRMRLRTAFALRDTASAAADALPRLALPCLLVQQGSADAVTPGGGNVLADGAARVPDRTLLLYDGAWHALFSEPADTRRRVVLDMLAWMRKRVPGMPPRPPPGAGGEGGEDECDAPEAELTPRANATAAAAAGGGDGAADAGGRGAGAAGVVVVTRPAGAGPFRDATVWSAAPIHPGLPPYEEDDEGAETETRKPE